MSQSTIARIAVIQKYLRQNFRSISNIDQQNIAGFRVAKKIKGGEQSRFYSIIFQVDKKIQTDVLQEDLRIPKSIEIPFPDGKIRKIKTDVEETGSFTFHNGIGGTVVSKLSQPGSFGTAGLFVTDGNDRTFLLTNYHVVAENLMAQKKYFYQRPPGANADNVRFTTINGNQHNCRFEIGSVDQDVDVAFVQLPIKPDNDMNDLGNGNKIAGRVATIPIPSSFVGRPAIIFSASNPNGIGTHITDNSTILLTGNRDISFIELIQFEKRTIGGDSGSVVVTPNLLALGLIMGADQKYSYAIPLYKINFFKSFKII